ERELVYERDFTAAIPKLVDVKHRAAMRREVFEKYRPTVVFHAAAYKHVPLMETHPLESVRNNVAATRVVAELAAEFEVERLVLISSGSVIPPFRKQIEKGGPVTVTSPEMTRYFMTIPEGVSLVVQAGAIG